MQDEFIDILLKRFKQPLPGRDAQLKMAHVTRRLYQSFSATKPQKAGVLALLFMKNEEVHVLIIERMQAGGDKHGGQLGFPGGKYEPNDKTLLDTAVREAEEEVGIPSTEVNVLGPLTTLYIPVSNFLVHPFVGYLNNTPKYQLQEKEVKAVLEVPLSHLMNPENKRTTDIRIGKNLILKNVPYFDVEGKVLWGATAMMLSELIEVMNGN